MRRHKFRGKDNTARQKSQPPTTSIAASAVNSTAQSQVPSQAKVPNSGESTTAPGNAAPANPKKNFDNKKFNGDKLRVRLTPIEDYEKNFVFRLPEAPGRVTSRLERLMGSDKIDLMNYGWMHQLDHRLVEDEKKGWNKRRKERKQIEHTRYRKLAIDGLMPVPADMQDIYSHPIFRVNAVLKRLNKFDYRALLNPKQKLPPLTLFNPFADDDSGKVFKNFPRHQRIEYLSDIEEEDEDEGEDEDVTPPPQRDNKIKTAEIPKDSKAKPITTVKPKSTQPQPAKVPVKSTTSTSSKTKGQTQPETQSAASVKSKSAQPSKSAVKSTTSASSKTKEQGKVEPKSAHPSKAIVKSTSSTTREQKPPLAPKSTTSRNRRQPLETIFENESETEDEYEENARISTTEVENSETEDENNSVTVSASREKNKEVTPMNFAVSESLTNLKNQYDIDEKENLKNWEPFQSNFIDAFDQISMNTDAEHVIDEMYNMAEQVMGVYNREVLEAEDACKQLTKKIVQLESSMMNSTASSRLETAAKKSEADVPKSSSKSSVNAKDK